MKELIDILAEYGLSDKESKVYLSMLELGPASVQDIAKKAGVNRATTYVMIEALKKRGLMSTFEKGRKTVFVAESPDKLKRLADTELHAAQEKEDRLASMMPNFMALFNSSSQEKPAIRFFEGEEGFKDVRNMYAQTKDEMLCFLAVDEAVEEYNKRVDEQGRIELNNNLRGRNIVAIKQGSKLPWVNLKNFPTREIPYSDFPFSGEVIFFDGNKVTLDVMKTKPIIFLIESKEIYNLLRAMFESAWKVGKPIDSENK